MADVPISEPAVVQQYVTNPLLLDGFKFDLRLYVLVTSFAPLECFLYEEGFGRLSTLPFRLDAQSLSNKFIHLTNSSVQKDNPNTQLAAVESNEGGSKISLATLKQKLSSKGIDVQQVWNDIDKLIIKTLLCVEDSITPSPSSFELFGFDVLIDDTLRPYLIEVNASPSMGLDTELDRVIKPRLIKDTINLVDPLPFNRWYLSYLLERRLMTGIFEERAPKNKAEKQQRLNEMMYYLLNQQKPRMLGEMPQKMGLYRRLAPSPVYDQLLKMKRAAFQPSTTVEAKYKRTLPNLV